MSSPNNPHPQESRRHYRNIIVGSGPSGIACAYRLLNAGEEVLLIDGGEKLEQDTARRLSQLATQPKEAWDKDFLHSLTQTTDATPKGVSLKLAFGSDFPYRGNEETVCSSSGIGHLTTSLACGGFSNVWGAAVLPYTERDLQDWPIKLEDLQEGYQAATTLMRIAGQHDSLLEAFPLHTTSLYPLNLSQQTLNIYQRLERKQPGLRERGFISGQARVALNHSTGKESSDCVYCGRCMYGCPYNLIYNSLTSLSALLATFPPQLTYQPGFFVKAFAETSGQVTVRGWERKSEKTQEFCGDRLFLGAGCLATSRIILESLNVYEAEVPLQVSEYFLLPFLGPAVKGSLDTHESYTLAQIFLEYIGDSISKFPIHLQLYGYNDLYRRALQQMLGPIAKLSTPLLRRLIVGQGYLHSTESSSITLRLSRADSARLKLEGQPNPAAAKTIKRFVRSLTRLSIHTGILPIRPMLSIGAPGEGRHAGGTFPMTLPGPAKGKGQFTSDLLGRPASLKRVHIIDSSCLPSIPAPTITFTTMANAYRIANEAVISSSLPDRLLVGSDKASNDFQ